jgi:transposase
MGRTNTKNNQRYTLEFKQQAVKLASHPNVMAKDIAESLGIHPVMLYRWRMEHNRGELKENKNMTVKKVSPKRLKKKTDPSLKKDDEIIKANRRIKQLEKELAFTTEELNLLKKAERFLAKKTKK